MRILLDCRPLQQLSPTGEQLRFFSALIRGFSAAGTDWIFLADKNELDHLPAAVPAARVQLVVKKSLPGRWGLKWWYDRQIARAAKNHGAEAVWTTGGQAASRLEVPQYCWIPADTRAKPAIPHKSLRLADKIFCIGEKEKERLLKYGKPALPAEKVHSLFPVADTLVPGLGIDEKQAVKDLHSEGREYFFADIQQVGSDAVIQLLKAFSLFKKRQRSNMKLLLAVSQGAGDPLKGKLKNYKFRQDVFLIPQTGAAQRQELLGAAYGIICFPHPDMIGLGLLDGCSAGVPVINLTGLSFDKEASPPADLKDTTQLGELLKSLYKDEAFRLDLIEKGTSLVQRYTPAALAAEVRNSI